MKFQVFESAFLALKLGLGSQMLSLVTFIQIFMLVKLILMSQETSLGLLFFLAVKLFLFPLILTSRYP